MFRKSATNLSKLPVEQVKTFINSFDTILVDCDHVLWIFDKVIEGSPEVLNKLRKLGKEILFVTNNPVRTRKGIAEKARSLGYEAYENEMISASFLPAQYLKDMGFNKTVYVIGNEANAVELEEAGIKHTGIGPDVIKKPLLETVKSLKLEEDVGAVLISFDEHFSYPKMLRACSYLANKDCLFIGSNKDENYGLNSSITIPVTGSFIKAIEVATGREANVIGKPNIYIGEYIKRIHNIVPERTLMIGDKGDTDILFGTRCGFQTLMVLSGLTTPEQIEAWKTSEVQSDQDLVPDVYLDKLGDLMPFLS